jgi:uncharacterized protein (DUF1330 family)
MVYAYVNLSVTDETTFAAYRERAGAALAKHGARVVISTPAQSVIEGNRDATGRGVILEFDTREAALGWINDPDLQEVHALRRSSGNSAITLLA